MCLIVFSWQPGAENPLTLVANRDEFYDRPTETVQFWDDKPHILGGRDLQAGGSWFALNRTGRFAAVTNYRQVPVEKGLLSRGKLVSDFLDSNMPPKEYLSLIHQNASQYTGFNLLIGDSSGLYYYSNKLNSIITLKPGLYGLSNRLLNTPWPKLESARQGLGHLLDEQNQASPDALIQLMKDSTPAPDQYLPDTGIGPEKEKLLSSCFIASPGYGTRNTSALTLKRDGTLQWTEQLYEEGREGQRFQFSLKTSLQWNFSGQVLDRFL